MPANESAILEIYTTHRVFGAAAARRGTLGFGKKTKIQRRRKQKRMASIKYRYVFSGMYFLAGRVRPVIALYW